MASENVHTFTDENFEASVLQAEEPVLVDFGAEWCMPCRMIAPTIEEIAADYAGRAKVGTIDTDANRNIGIQYQISAIPTVILFKGGEVAKKFVGLTGKNDLAAAIDEALG
ncbi:MAG: thioredoxin [Phycisphaerales bacterium]|nr:thioredoxin [Phycisphaerales bacterium]